MTDPLLRLEDVSFDYRHSDVPVHAVRHAELTVVAGDYVAVVGPSGSGKSTLLGLMGLLHSPDVGRVQVNGQDTADLDDRRRSAVRQRTMGFVFQQYHLLPNLDARANVETALMLRGISRAARRARALACLDRVGLGDRASHRPNQLSGGEQQRVALARAIAPEPQLVLADEPTGNLDSDNRARLLDLLDELHADGTALVVVTHDGAVADRTARRVEVVDGVVEEHDVVEEHGAGSAA